MDLAWGCSTWVLEGWQLCELGDLRAAVLGDLRAGRFVDLWTGSRQLCRLADLRAAVLVAQGQAAVQTCGLEGRELCGLAHLRAAALGGLVAGSSVHMHTSAFGTWWLSTHHGSQHGWYLSASVCGDMRAGSYVDLLTQRLQHLLTWGQAALCNCLSAWVLGGSMGATKGATKGATMGAHGSWHGMLLEWFGIWWLLGHYGSHYRM